MWMVWWGLRGLRAVARPKSQYGKPQTRKAICRLFFALGSKSNNLAREGSFGVYGPIAMKMLFWLSKWILPKWIVNFCLCELSYSIAVYFYGQRRGNPNLPLNQFFYHIFFLAGKRWFCHFDDDSYVNIPSLVRKLSTFDSNEKIFLGRRPTEFPNFTLKGRPGVTISLFLVIGHLCLIYWTMFVRYFKIVYPFFHVFFKDMEDISLSPCVVS